ncbi:ABC transporter substrate-binding protein [Chelatococcus asaccharovorans]|uniref:ABC transporter substrate-binding protein n=1 Tax=Chelatococcus asaccharovorans TaxID=28210 RepID=UPI00224C674B|nr:extracellular solute-binding protein [Chelatococcus asaccharovorans]CAH1672596.1 Maltose/maltodextrin ABC transporter, substrate binding periplasmic protein MalE [Chelatococcus asaccharovorans]CAH1676003.1 Maltose/maltodextrin ABC transporter, substrate binding periplasmic protein MalE [Chelatococcus asaccharovorans]
MRYRALTWDHPRGYNALAAAAGRLDARRDGLAIDWDKQPLEGFEAHPIEDLCARYDLVVMDHPHVGEAVARGCLRALEDVFPEEDIAAWGRDSIGPSLASYRFGGVHWALPLDAATQVMALRADLLDEAPPRTWQDVLDLSRRKPVVLSLAGPHACLSFLSIAAALGEPPAVADADVLISETVGLAVLAIMAELDGRMPEATRAKNPIGILEHMARHDDVALCPLVYGYVNYAAPREGQGLPITFANAPRGEAGGHPGSTLGGTGIGLSTRCEITPQLLDHLRWLLGAETQRRFIPDHDGQPSRRAAWHDAGVNARWGGFYANTAETLEAAYVRPRHDGYIAFQTDAAAMLRDALAARSSHREVLARLQDRYAESRRSGGER